MFGGFGAYCSRFFDYGRFPFGGGIMMILGVVIIAALIYFIWKASGNTKNTPSESALDILQKRFVNGEISEEEYKSKKQILEGK